ASGAQSINNNFGELKASSLSGFVYVDTNNNGIKDAGEAGIANVQVTLNGVTDSGPVSQNVMTDAAGAYQFNNLTPGTYSLNESQPAGYLDGKDAVGPQGGNAANDNFSNLALLSGTNGVNNNFGELTPAGLSGFVFEDTNKNGVRDPGEPGIANVAIVLSGTDDPGGVSKTTPTDSAGHYTFDNLRPGTYALNETQPAGYQDGQDTIGSQGGTAGNDQFTNIALAAGVMGMNNNF